MQLSTSPDRVRTPLRIDLPRIGTVRPRTAAEVGTSNWTLGCETLDRDFADWDKYRDYLAPLGINMIRLQAGWAKCERVRGTYDFAWLDHIVDDARSMGVDAMLEKGLVDEVRGLLQSGVKETATAMQAIGYKEIVSFLHGACTLCDSVEAVKRGSRRYAKRQMTWMRRNPEIHWLDRSVLPELSQILPRCRQILSDFDGA